MPVTVVLGPLVLRDFEVPEKIVWGGEQRVIVQRLPGGGRVLDALGRDDCPVQWNGCFSGPDALLRARAMDLLRVQGIALPLSWDGFYFTVLITRLEIDYSRPNWMPYRIACTVLRDEADQVVLLALGASQSILADLGAASANGVLDTTSSQSAVSADGATLSGTNTNVAAAGALSQARDSLQQTQQAAEATFTTAPGDVADAAGTMAFCSEALGYVQRAAANLALASS